MYNNVLLMHVQYNDRFCGSNGCTVCCEKVQTLNSGECSELVGTLTSPTKMLEDERLADDVQAIDITKAERRYETTNMMLFNNGHDVTVMNTSATQLTMQQPVVSSLDPVWPVSDTTTACQNNLYLATDIQSIVLSQSKAVTIYPYFSSCTLEVSITSYIAMHAHKIREYRNKYIVTIHNA